MALMNCRVSNFLFALITILPLSQSSICLHSELTASPNEQWVSTWTTAMQIADSSFSNQTIRMIVRTTLGGDQVRIRLSNFYGTETLPVGATHIGLYKQGPAIVGGTDRQLTFSGRNSTLIPPGAYVISDPVRLDVPQLGQLAISVYLPERTGVVTGQGVGLQTTYISPAGDFTKEAEMPVSATSQSYYWLAEVYIARPTAVPLIVAFGDSITNGTYSTPNTNRSWPSVLGELLLVRSANSQVSVVNQGVGGNRILLPAHDTYSSNAVARFDRDALDHPGVKTVIFLEGINDIGSPPGPGGKHVTAPDLIAAAQQIITRCHLRGVKIVGGTLVPFAGAPYFSENGEVTRKAFNQWIRDSGSFDAVIDFEQAVRDPKQTDRFLPLFDCGDHLHPSDAGYHAMAVAAAAVLFKHEPWMAANRVRPEGARRELGMR